MSASGLTSGPDAPAAPITLALPYYSGFELALRALRSIATQTCAESHTLVCDDSPDGLRPAQLDAIAETFAGRRPCRVVRNAQNLGMARTWNRCLDEARTDLVTLVHGDDELEPTYAATMVELAAQQPGATLLFCGAQIIGASGKSAFSFPDRYKELLIPRHAETLTLEGDRGLTSLLRGNYIFCPAICYRKSRLGSARFDPRFRMVLDFDLVTRLLLDDRVLVGLPKKRLYRYRRHEQSATQQLTKELTRFREESALYLDVAERARVKGFPRSARKARERRIVALNLAFCMARDGLQGNWLDMRRKGHLFRELFL